MKKLLSLAVIAAATSALAAVESTATFGVLRVDSTAAQTIVSVPWLGADGNEIKVKDVVKTSNLTEGDHLYYYENSAYKLWVLENGAWKGATMVANGIEPTAGSDSDTLTRGGALILVRKSPSTPFYLYGQYTSAGSYTEMAKGTSSSWAFSLLAPPKTGDTDLNTGATWSNVQAADAIVITGGMTLSWNDTDKKWGKRSFVAGQGNKWDYTVAVIPAGMGAWYISKTGTDVAENATKVTW